MNKLAQEEFVVYHTSVGEEYGKSRDTVFRRLVLNSYDETCAVCGLNIVISSGVSVIDAAHILHLYRFKNDGLMNGLALCKRHHWLFDQGLISVDGDYSVKVSRSIEEERTNEVVSRFREKEIRLLGGGKRPDSVALEQHRCEVFKG